MEERCDGIAVVVVAAGEEKENVKGAFVEKKSDAANEALHFVLQESGTGGKKDNGEKSFCLCKFFLKRRRNRGGRRETKSTVV